MATRLWSFLTTDIREMACLDTANRAADAADAVLGLAAALATEGPQVQQLAPLVSQLDSLLDALNSPLGKLVGSPLSLAPISTGLLKIYQESTAQMPTLAQSVALTSQAAYLESFRDFVNRHPKVKQWVVSKDTTPEAKTITLEMKALSLFELTEEEAQVAALHFHRSALARMYNAALDARLVQLGATPEIAQRMVNAVAKGGDRYLQRAIAAHD